MPIFPEDKAVEYLLIRLLTIFKLRMKSTDDMCRDKKGGWDVWPQSGMASFAACGIPYERSGRCPYGCRLHRP